MLPYKHITLEERKSLYELACEGYSIRMIADALGRSPSTISRELKRNGSKYPRDKSRNKFHYHFWHAQKLSVVRRRKIIFRRLVPGTPEWDFIDNGLRRFWTPDEIVKRYRLEHPKARVFGVSTIYRYIARKRFPLISAKTHLMHRGKRICKRDANYNTIQPDRIIPEWIDAIKNRERVGDWEGDTVYGGTGKGLAATFVDRKSRFLCARLLTSRNATQTGDVIIKMLEGLPVRSISLDNGSEFADFKRVEAALHTLIYFAEPHKPWQRGTNENTNNLLRFFFPKGFDFRSITDEELQAVVDLINDRPRKVLGYRTPREVFFAECVALG